MSNAEQVTVLRDGKQVTIVLQEKLNLLHMLEESPAFITAYVPAVIDSVLPTGAMAKAGVRKGDYLLAVDGTDIETWADFDSLMLRRSDVLSMEGCTHSDSVRLRQMNIVFRSADGARQDTAQIQLDENYMMGIAKSSPYSIY